MPAFILRGIDPDFWIKVKTKAASEGITVKTAIYAALNGWLKAKK